MPTVTKAITEAGSSRMSAELAREYTRREPTAKKQLVDELWETLRGDGCRFGF